MHDPIRDELEANHLIIKLNIDIAGIIDRCRICRHSSMDMIESFIEIPVEKFKTGGAKVRFLKICMLNTGGRRHDAMFIHTMGEAKGMTQFVHCGLFHSSQYKVRVCWLIIKLRTKPMCGDEGIFTFYLRQSKNVLEDSHIQI